MDQVTVTLPSGRQISYPYGTRTAEITREEEFRDGSAYPILAAMVNNELTSLSFKVEVNARVSPVYLNSPPGMNTYKRSLCFLLAYAAQRLSPENKLIIGHSLGDGYYYSLEGPRECDDEAIRLLDREMRSLVEADIPIQRDVVSYSDAMDYFQTIGYPDTALLLKHRSEGKIPVYRCGDYMDLAHGPLAVSTGLLESFEVRPYPPGFLLRFPSIDTPLRVGPFRDNPILFSIYSEYKQWGKILGVHTTGRLNDLNGREELVQFINVSEALQDKKIAEIADRISERIDDLKVILIAGPSSSGKTTFAKKLEIQLRVLGLQPVPISLDDYFLPRELTPRDENGEFDFESIHALDIPFLNEQLLQLFRGEEVLLPAFDFKLGGRKETGHPLRLPERGIVVMEGIHGLNDELTSRIARSAKYKVYVSALTQLNLDDHNRIPTTDNRLLRRMVRDHQFRGYSALETLNRWPSVRRGEERNIFPFQNSADTAFNSALDYELGVLKQFVEPLLKTVKPHHPVYHEAVRLTSFLNNFHPIPTRLIPSGSILREFIGGSSFKY